ncbi:hypothetical protein FRB94_009624 [Tulasnella sp. JGI-2019a]|nr:hypothetical protein FRB94_009624 [Tulasnella sp. JGI-2019a]KAG9017764.1 hypothetical protein FRB93_004575 [Tulasnella sp. JGI-2019a]
MADDSHANGPDTSSQQSLYEGSTQYRHWRFSKSALRSLRSAQNVKQVEYLRDTFERDQPGTSSTISFLSAEEENALVKLYIGKVGQLCAHFRFPEEVEATAVSYLKRFYLKNTVMDYHPKNVMLTTIFLAAKTSNHPIGIDLYVNNIPKTKASDVLDLEFLVAQSLRFEFTVWHAHRALWGIWLDVQDLPDFNGKSTYDDDYQNALSLIRASRLTDAELIYTPSQIALSCFHSTSRTLAEQWIHSKSLSTGGQNGALVRILDDIQQMIESDSIPPDVEFVRGIDKRLKHCTNPEKVKGSSAYLAKQAAVEAEAAKKRAEKAEEVRLAAESNPFVDSAPSQSSIPGIPRESQMDTLQPSHMD